MVNLNPFPLDDADSVHEEVVQDEDATGKSKWQKVWPVFACGAGLFSDGYLNAVCFFFFYPPPPSLAALCTPRC
jgi:hypothetical protein